MTTFILKVHQKLSKAIGVLRSQEYSEWKESEIHHNSLANLITQQSILSIFIISMLLVNYSETYDLMNLLLAFVLICGIFASLMLNRWLKNFEFSQFVGIGTTTTILLFGTDQNENYAMFLLQMSIMISYYHQWKMKLFHLLVFMLLLLFYYQQPVFELIFLVIFILVYIGHLEFKMLKLYIKEAKLTQILGLMPNALCILNTNESSIIYANSLFENLAKTLINQKNESSLDNDLLYMEFIDRLNLEQIKNSGFQITDLIPQIQDEGITEDQYEIMNVDFNKQHEILTSQVQSPTKSNSLPRRSLIMQQKNQKEFLTEMERKSYTTTINLQLRILHQPKSYVMSALTKRRKLSSQGLVRNIHSQKQIGDSSTQQQQQPIRISPFKGQEKKLSIGEKIQISTPQNDDQLLSQCPSNHYQFDNNISDKMKSIDQMEQPNSTATHQIKLLVNLIEITDLIEQEQNMKIYCINELTPLILQINVKKLEQVKKNILRSLSHELYTSLNSVKVYIEQAYEQSRDNPQINILLSKSVNFITLMKYKLQDFFDYRAILDKKLKIKKEKFNLKPIIQYTVDLIRDQCEQKRLRMDVVFPDTEIIVHGDIQKLYQVLLNILHNGIRHTERGGITIKISLSSVSSSVPALDSATLVKYVEVSICDTGIGMTEQQKGLLMKKLLYCDDDDTKIDKNSVGVGVGLTVAKSIIELMCPKRLNTLFIDSQEGVGSKFYFYLNYDRRSQIKFSDNEIPDPDQNNIRDIIRVSPTKQNYTTTKQDLSFVHLIIPCKCSRILLVDDESFNIDCLLMMIGQIQSEIECANNGVQTLQLIHKKQSQCDSCLGYKLILMDINMPIMNGWDCVERIRQFETQCKFKRTPIIAITSFSSEHDQSKCIRKGFDQVLQKPVEKSVIQQLLKKYNVY